MPFLIPTWAVAQTWGRFVLVRRGFERDVDVIAHELVHVDQWRFYGFGFLWRYLLASIKWGYLCNPYEVAARHSSERPAMRQRATELIGP